MTAILAIIGTIALGASIAKLIHLILAILSSTFH
jgi:hypothetical protein